jgi:hypothetical protein
MSYHDENIRSASTRDFATMERLAQLYDPMEAVHWTYGRALAWVGDRDANTVLEYSESLMIAGTSREIWREESFETWPAAGFVDTQFGCFMKPEVAPGETQVQ